jgi:hypothetical protein
MDQERSEVRQVEDARERVAQDVRSMAENANVVDRAKETAQNRLQDVRDRMEMARGQMQRMAQNMRLNPTENPLGMLFAGLAVGFLVGLMLPVTRFESERIGPMTEGMKDRARELGSQVARRGSEVIKDTIEATKEAAGSSMREQMREMGRRQGGGTSDTGIQG